MAMYFPFFVACGAVILLGCWLDESASTWTKLVFTVLYAVSWGTFMVVAWTTGDWKWAELLTSIFQLVLVVLVLIVLAFAHIPRRS